MFDFTPNPIAIQLGPVPVYWYGIGYALGLAAAYLVMVRLAKRAGEDADILGNGIIIVAIAALIGGRAYHVFDQWEELYKNDPIKIFLPPYSGLGVYGGIISGTIAAFVYARYKGVPFLRWADIVAPGLFTMQAIARWGNFFNQELYGSPTTLPWGIPIECVHRVEAYACASFPESTRFHPLFLYESISGVLGLLLLVWMGYHLRHRLRVGDLLLTFFVWYGVTRFFLETFRVDNWLFFGIPVAQIVSVAFVIPALVVLAWRHRSGHPVDDPASRPEVATWGAIGGPPRATDDDWDDDDWDEDDDDDADDGDDSGHDAGEHGDDDFDDETEAADTADVDDSALRDDEPESTST